MAELTESCSYADALHGKPVELLVGEVINGMKELGNGTLLQDCFVLESCTPLHSNCIWGLSLEQTDGVQAFLEK